MTVAPPRRRSRIVFWIAAIAIVSAIVATALLANDERNLRAIAERYHIAWLDTAPSPPPKPAPQARRGGRLAMKVRAVEKPMAQHLFDSLQATPSDMLRRWRVSGEQLCARIAEANIAVGRWHQGDLDTSTFECSYETPTNETSATEQPSLFVIVRGTPAGDVFNVRIKAILPETPAGAALKQRFLALVAVLLRETRWGDLDEAVGQIGKLQNVTQSSFGAKLVFSHEFGDPRRFNLILDLDKSSPDESATAAFFDTSKWFALPPSSRKN